MLTVVAESWKGGLPLGKEISFRKGVYLGMINDVTWQQLIDVSNITSNGFVIDSLWQ